MTGKSIRKAKFIFWLVTAGLFFIACSLFSSANPTPSPTTEPTVVAETASTPAGEDPGSVSNSDPTPVVSPTPFKPFFEPANCVFIVQPGVEVDCGFVEVTEDRAGNPADTIRVAVAVYRSQTSAESAVPTFFLQGGPGAPSLTWAAGFYDAFVSPLLAQGDVIFMDHRGTGLSEPNLNCPEIEEVYLQDFQQDWDGETRAQNYMVAFVGCKGRLVLNGANISAYTTTAAAADVHDIAAVLGYDQVNLYGISYGSRLGQAVMRDYPELVRSAVLDSVVPLEAKMYNDATERANYALEALFSGCTADAVCLTTYPGLEDKFYELLARFEVEPVNFALDNPAAGQPLNVSVDDSSLLNAMMWALHFPGYAGQAPKMIDDIYEGDYAILKQLKDLPFVRLSNINIGLRLSIECHEQIFPTTAEEMEADINTYPALVDYGYSYIFGSVELIFSACEAWGAAPFDPADKEPLRSEIPTLILAGQYDPTTPAYYGRQLAANLPNSYFFELAGHGHSPSVGSVNDCGLSLALNFLADPTSDPTLPCLDEYQQTFFVPFDGATAVVLEPFIHEQYFLQGLAPSGWLAVDNGYYNRDQFWGDPTQIGFQSSGSTAVEWLIFLESNYQNIGLDTTPQLAGVHEANGRTWELYTAEARGEFVDIALVELPGGVSWLVMMTSDPAERDAFYESLFLPTINALAPWP